VTRSAEKKTGHQHTARQQRKDLFHKAPGRLHPGCQFIAGEPRLEHEGEDPQEEEGQVPFDGEDKGPKTGIVGCRPGESSEYQDQHHGQQVERMLQDRAFLGVFFGNVDLLGGAVGVVMAENEGHQQPGNHGEEHRTDGAGETELPSQDSGGEHDGKHVDGRPRIEERRCRANACPAQIDAGKKRQHGARTDGKHRAGHRGHGVGEDLVGLRSEILQDGGLRDKDGDGAGDEEGWHQAGQNVFAGVFLQHHEGFEPGTANDATFPWDIVTGEVDQDDAQ